MSVPTQGRQTILGLLRDESRLWWAHNDWRAVNKAVRRDVEVFRALRDNGGCVTVGRGGCTAYFQPNARREGYDDITGCTPTVARKLGVLVVDTTTIPADRLVHWAVCSPMPDFETSRFGTAQGQPFGSLDSLTFQAWARLAATFGATVYNGIAGALPDAKVSRD